MASTGEPPGAVRPAALFGTGECRSRQRRSGRRCRTSIAAAPVRSPHRSGIRAPTGVEARLLLTIPARVHLTPFTGAAAAGVEERGPARRRRTQGELSVPFTGDDADGVGGDHAQGILNGGRRAEPPAPAAVGSQDRRGAALNAAVVDDPDSPRGERVADRSRCRGGVNRFSQFPGEFELRGGSRRHRSASTPTSVRRGGGSRFG